MMILSEIAKAVNGELKGVDCKVSGVATDTRTISRGELFVALKGPNFDGHDFVGEAHQSGAVAALLQKESNEAIPQIIVADTLDALGALAASWRSRFSIPLVAVTGSNGKTTVKEMVGSILLTRGPCLISLGNLNNQIGLPLGLCRLNPHHHYAVVEMGMNRPGEIAYLSNLARPNVAIITNAAAAHLQGVGSVEGVAEAKAEILLELSNADVAILNRDDSYFDYWKQSAGNTSVISFGFHPEADVRALDYEPNHNRFHVCIRQQSIEIQLTLPGKHNVSNALAASAAAFSLGCELDQIKTGLQDLSHIPGRLQEKIGLHDLSILDDSYNANPASVKAGIDVLSDRSGTRILVLGEMGELGSDAESMHRDIGIYAEDREIDGLYGLGPMTRYSVKGFGKNGHYFRDRSDLIQELRTLANSQTTLLIKGSRRMHMEEVVSALQQPDSNLKGRC